MAIGDLEVCSSHQDSLVALFCQTCEELICTRCVCQGAHSAAPHRDHVYLDIMEAFALHKEDIEKLQGKVKDIVVRTKTARQDSQNRLNKMKLELLRRRTLVERRKRALVERVDKDETGFVQALEGVVRPALDNEEQRVRELDYQAVSREGFLGHLDSLRRMSSKESRAFLKNYVKFKKQLDELIQESQAEEGPPDHNVEEQQKTIRSVNLQLHAEMRAIGRAFQLPSAVPGKPRPLLSWSVVGANSVALVWKHPDGIKVDKAKIYYRPSANRPSTSFVFIPPTSSPDGLSASPSADPSASSSYDDSISVKYRAGRCCAVLRNLRPDTSYDVKICGVNVCGEGEGAGIVVRTLSQPEDGQWRVWHAGKEGHRKSRWMLARKTLYSLLVLAVFLAMGIILMLLGAEKIICERIVGNIKSHSAVDVCSPEQRQFLHSQLTACDAPGDSQDYYLPPSGLWVQLAQWWHPEAPMDEK